MTNLVDPSLEDASEDRGPFGVDSATTLAHPSRPVVVVANRLPGSFDAAGRWARSPGGLVSALSSALDGGEATWIGAVRDGPAPPATATDGTRLVGVRGDEDLYAAYCAGFANGALWPLYHDAIVAPTYERSWWDAYETMNRHFAEVTAQNAPEDALVWIHDYHLELVPSQLRLLRPDVRIGYFHHVPFPNIDLFRQLPWRTEIISGLLGADLLGFQRTGDVANFRAAAALGGWTSSSDAPDAALSDGQRLVQLDAFPVPVDAAAFAVRSSAEPTGRRAQEIRLACGSPVNLLLGVDRLDYTKGIDQRLGVIRALFSQGVLQPGRDAYLQVAVPSRADANGYAELRARVERLVGDINGEFASVGAPVVHYLHRSVDVDELTALYRAADVMLVTPFRDGMNLVAKEYVASRTDGTGALVLSEFTGAADELRGALLINPHDTRSLADAISATLDAPDRGRAAMRTMRACVAGQSPADWAARFLERLANAR